MNPNEIPKWLDSASIDIIAAKILYGEGRRRKKSENLQLLALYHLQQANEKVNKVAIKLFGLLFSSMIRMMPDAKVKYRKVYKLINEIASTEEKTIGHDAHKWFDQRARAFLILFKTGEGNRLMKDFTNSIFVATMVKFIESFNMPEEVKTLLKEIISFFTSSINEFLEKYRLNLKIAPPPERRIIEETSDFERIEAGISIYKESTGAINHAFNIADYSEFKIAKGSFNKKMLSFFTNMANMIDFLRGLVGTTTLSFMFENFEFKTRYPDQGLIDDRIFERIPELIRHNEECQIWIRNSSKFMCETLESISSKQNDVTINDD